MSSLSFWNKSLTATEVKELYSGASVPFKYKGANQTASYTSDFSSGVDSWAAVRSTAAGNIDSIGGQNDTLRVTIDGSSGVDHYVRRAGSGMTAGKSYRAKFDYYIPSGNSVVDQISVNGAGNEITMQYLGTTDSWVTKTIDFDNPYNTAVQDFPIIFSGATGGSNVLSGTSAQNDVFYIKNFTFTPIGAVAEYDGSGAGEKIWGDKSGNDLHGTVTGATLENTPYDSGTEYEEGEWSIGFTDPSGDIAVNASYNTGAYTRIGRVVHVTGNIRFSSGTASGDVILTGLPYTRGNFTEEAEESCATIYTEALGAAIDGYIGGYIVGTSIYLRENGTTGDGTDLGVHIDSGTSIVIQGTYFV